MQKVFKSLFFRPFSCFSIKISQLPGIRKKVTNTREVQLRGTYIKGKYNDLPNLIFLSEALDPATNWIQFFTKDENRFLEYRNIYLLNARNFGNSDFHDSFALEEMADDVVRFMYDNKISTATLGGHGIGGKLALAVGCYHAERVTGVFCLDSSPMDQRYHESFGELKQVVLEASKLDLTKSKNEIDKILKEKVLCPKWRSILNQNLITTSDEKKVWNFNINALNHNLQFNNADSLGYWAQKHGLFTGRALFAFPDYSRWVHLNTNTLPMLKVCTILRGFNSDIFCIQGDENPLNHWIYDFPQISFGISRKILQFIQRYDGVHNLLYDRDEVGKYFIPDKPNSRNKSDWEYADYSPAHYHHNWRFNNVYEKHGQVEEHADKKK